MKSAEEWNECLSGDYIAGFGDGEAAGLLFIRAIQADARASALKEAAYSYKVPELQNKDAELVALRFCQQFRVAILSLLAKDETP